MLFAVFSTTSCSEDKAEKRAIDHLLKTANEKQKLENLSRQHVMKNCKSEFNSLKALGVTSETPEVEVMHIPEYIGYMKCAGKADKLFLAGILKKEKTKGNELTNSTALGMINAAIFKDIQSLCIEEDSGFDRNICYEEEIKKVRNSLGID